MKITESRLRQVIREVIKESYDDSAGGAFKNDNRQGSADKTAKTISNKFPGVEVELRTSENKMSPVIKVLDGSKTYEISGENISKVYSELETQSKLNTDARSPNFFEFMQKLGMAK